MCVCVCVCVRCNTNNTKLSSNLNILNMFVGKPDSKKIKACELGKYFLKDVAYKA